MKIGIFSDLHLEFDKQGSEYQITPEDDVFYLCAGDVHPNAIRRRYFFNSLKENIFSVEGNHDFYGSFFDQTLTDDALKTRTLPNGMKVAGATLWTNLTDPYDWYIYTRCLVDYGYIYGMNKDAYNDAHTKHLNFLMKSGADIIVTHHCPSRHSIHPKYANEKSNVCFTTDLTEAILAMDNPPKLWVHGHTHESFDYMIGSTRVLCHPRGYPRERSHYETYKPMIMEI